MSRVRSGRRRSLVAVSVAGVLGLTMAASASAATTPTPTPSPSASVPSTTPPPIALMPPGSSLTGSLVGITADDGARTVAQKWIDLRTVDITVYSPAVVSNVVIRVFVPSGWRQTATPTWPLVMMLHGGQDDYTSWDRETKIKAISAHWGAVVAMPDAGQSATFTNFYNDGKYGPPQWETFHTVELLQILQRTFGTNDKRSIAGLSSGGYGSMAYATRNPKLWKFAASYSGAIAIRQSPMREVVIAGDAVYGDGFNRFGVPIVNESNWASHDPYTNADKLRGMGVFLSSGYTGFPSSQDTVGWTPIQLAEIFSGNITLMFDIKLSLLGIKHTTDLYPFGEHAWASWETELEKSWPMMMTAIGAKKF